MVELITQLLITIFIGYHSTLSSQLENVEDVNDKKIYELEDIQSMDPLQKVLAFCEMIGKADGSYNYIDLEISYQNATHYIDNITCEWELNDD